MTFGLAWSMVTAPIENDPCPSKIGENEMPPLVDFHTPPADAPTYHVLLSEGSIATSDTRPDVSAGPMERSLRPASKPVVNFELSGGAAGFFDWAPAIVDPATNAMTIRIRIRVCS